MNVKNLSKSELLSIRGDIDSQLEYLNNNNNNNNTKETLQKTKLSDLEKGDLIYCIVFNGTKVYDMDYVNINFYMDDDIMYKGLVHFYTEHNNKLRYLETDSYTDEEVMSNSYFLTENRGTYRFFTMNPKTWKEDLNSEMIRLIKKKDEKHRKEVANIESNIQAQINSDEVDRYIKDNNY